MDATLLIRVGDSVEWDKDAHTHTKQMKIPNTGKIEGILPEGFNHVDDRVEECQRKDACIIFVKVDNSTARIGLLAKHEDLKFSEQEEKDLDDWEDDLF